MVPAGNAGVLSSPPQADHIPPLKISGIKNRCALHPKGTSCGAYMGLSTTPSKLTYSTIIFDVRLSITINHLDRVNAFLK